MMSKKYRSLWLFFLSILLVFQLTGCEDKETEQRKAFVDFLQNTVMRGGHQVPTLSEDQRKRMGNYVSDYAILVTFSQQISKSVQSGLIPAVSVIEQIKTPEDYVQKLDALQNATGTLNLLVQQIQASKIQADNAHLALKQPDDVKVIYDQAYNKVVTQQADGLSPLVPQLNGLAQDIIQTGQFIKTQGTQVSYANGKIQFTSAQAVAQYNELMIKLQEKQKVLQQAQSITEQIQ